MENGKHWLSQKSNTGAVVILSVALGASLTGNWNRPAPVAATDGAVATVEQRAALETLQNAFTSLAERVEPTVVSIEAVRNPSERSAEPEAPEANPFRGSPLEPFYRQFGQPGPRRGARSGGSGVIVRERGS